MNFLPSLPITITPIIDTGLLLILAAMMGYVAHRLSWLPSITGFLIIGFLSGPSGVGILTAEIMSELHVLIDVALSLILYRLGLSLDLKLICYTPGLLVTSLFESIATFVLVLGALFLSGMPPAIAGLVAAIAISSSPAVLLHVAQEVGAKGPVTESAKTLLALNNFVSFLAFSAILPLLHQENGSDWLTMLFQPLYRLLGSLCLGTLLAFILHKLALVTQKAPQYKLALVIGSLMISIGLAEQLNLSILFVPLVMGVVIKSIERDVIITDLKFGPAFELFFIILFVFTGAGLHLHELMENAPAVFSLVVARVIAKVLGTLMIARLYHKSYETGIAGGLLLIPMAGLAIGLVNTTSNLFPDYAATVSSIVLGAVTLFETMGPPIVAFAFRFAGESQR